VSGEVRVELPAELLETIAQRAAELVRAELEAPVWLTLEQAAEYVHATPTALRARARRGRLPGAVRDGARWLVDRRALDAALAGAAVPTDNRRDTRNQGRAPRKRPRPGTGG
jgi:excisionase family DNA binding protein